jgi:hypothetical protein
MAPLRSSQKTPSKPISNESSSKRISFNEPLSIKSNLALLTPDNTQKDQLYRDETRLEPGASSRKMNKSPSAMDDMLNPIILASPLIPTSNLKPDHHHSSSSLLRGGKGKNSSPTKKHNQEMIQMLHHNPSVPNLSKLVSDDPSRFEDYIESYYYDEGGSRSKSNGLSGDPNSRSRSRKNIKRGGLMS